MVIPRAAPFAQGGRGGRLSARWTLGSGIGDLCTRDIRNDTDDITEGVRNSASSNILCRAPAVRYSLPYLVCIHDGAATDLLRSSSDLLAVSQIKHSMFQYL